MYIDKSTFLVLVGTLAAGSAGGYFVSEKHLLEGGPGKPLDRESPSSAGDADASASVSITTTTMAADAAPAAPVCDDSAGSPGECPPPGWPAEEGGCGSLANRRCLDWKQTMKPRVAQAAVECLKALKPGERCDPNRVNLCEHLALVNACQADPLDALPPGSLGKTGSLTAVCEGVVKACGATMLGPTMVDCRQTLAGLNDVGRNRVAECTRQHCNDKGLLGCETVAEVK